MSKYKIYCKQRNTYFANGTVFDTLEEVRNQLISYHDDGEEDMDLSRYTLADLVDSFEWEIQDKNGNEIDYKLLELIK